jgi:MFS family permease
MTKTFGEAAFDLTVPARQLQVLAGSNEATATLLSVGTGCYVAGKLFLGQLGDILGGQALYAGSLCVAGCAFAGISVSTKLWHLCVSWGLANFALSSPWTGMMLACTPSWFNKLNGLGTVVALFGTASRTGVVVSNSILGP